MSIRPAIFRSFLQVSACQPLLKIDLQLRVDLSPVLPVFVPLFRDIHHCQVKNFQEAVICREYGLGFRYFPQLTVETFNRICCVDKASDCFRIFEMGRQRCPVVMPGFIYLGIFAIPFVPE